MRNRAVRLRLSRCNPSRSGHPPIRELFAREGPPSKTERGAPYPVGSLISMRTGRRWRWLDARALSLKKAADDFQSTLDVALQLRTVDWLGRWVRSLAVMITARVGIEFF